VEGLLTINEYELVLILRPDLDEAATTEILEKIETNITDHEGTLLVRDDWGQRKMAYEIQNHQKGRYVLEKFLSSPDLIVEIERRLRIEERVIRFLTVRKPGAVDVETRLAEATEERTKLAEEAAKREAEAAAQAQYEVEAKAAREAAAKFEATQAAAAAAASDDDDSDDTNNTDEAAGEQASA
jgi:small subunit ribosomal protein S6